METTTAPNVVEITRRCTKCGEDKPLSYFRPAKADGRQGNHCRTCRRREIQDRRRASVPQRTLFAEQICGGCGQVKPLAQFRRSRDTKSGYTSWCVKCLREKDRERAPKKYKAGAERQKWYYVRKKFGLERADFERMFNAQSGCCPICTRQLVVGKNTCVDHDHKTGNVRGLLCRQCNLSLGLLGDDPESFERASLYLHRARGDR